MQLYVDKHKARIRAQEMVHQLQQEKQIPIPFEPIQVMRDNKFKRCSEFKMISHEENDGKSCTIAKLKEEELQDIKMDDQYATPLELKENSKSARLAVTESFLSGQSKVVKIVLDEPLSKEKKELLTGTTSKTRG